MREYIGPAVVHSNRNIRKMLSLAGASSRDVFYDLGCGRGQLCVIAASEFHVKRAVGIEKRRSRAEKARGCVRSLGLSGRIDIRNEDYCDSNLSDATIAYNGLVEQEGDLEFYSDTLKSGCRLVTLQLPLVGVIPDSQDYPFYLMRKPFRRTRSSATWISATLSKKSSTEEFVRELREDPDYRTDIRTLKSLMTRRFAH